METLSAGGTNVLLFLTYLSFAAAITMYILQDIRTQHTLVLNGGPCAVNGTTTISVGGVASSCTNDFDSGASVWNSNITSLVNLIGDIQMFVLLPEDNNARPDLTSFAADIVVTACINKLHIQKCKYQDVLSVSKNFTFLPITPGSDGMGYRAVIFDVFQNQEIIENNGIIKAYRIQVSYKSNEGFVGSKNSAAYEFHYYSGINSTGSKIVQCVLCGFTVLFSFFWFHNLLMDEIDPRMWLRERKWLSWFLLGLLFLQNPIFCVAQWNIQNSTPTGWVAFLSSMMTSTGQTIIFTVFLLLADGIVEKATVEFYFPKIAFGLSMFTVYAFSRSLNFPSIYGSRRSSVLSVVNWSQSLQEDYIVFAVILLGLVCYWALIFIFSIIRTGQKLQQIPYIKSRYQHLSYRFLILQAVLVGAVFIMEYIIDIQKIFYSRTVETTSDKIADYLNSLFNTQDKNVAWTLFISVYIYTTLYLYLPVSRARLYYFLSRTYVMREVDMESADEIRQRDLRRMKKFGIFIPKFIEEKPIFCVETARWLLELSWQSYYDPAGKNAPGSIGLIQVEQYGFELLDYFWAPTCDTNCFILRHRMLNRIVVVFRGTMSKEHWSVNMKWHMSPINVHNLCPRGESLPSILEDTITEDRESTPHQERPLKPFFGRLKDNVSTGAKCFVRAGQAGVDFVIDELETAADLTRINRIPVLKHALTGYVHTGFWEAYSCIRVDLHKSLRRHLLESEDQLFLTGHSLGGALASFAAMDIAIHLLPKVNAIWAGRRGLGPNDQFDEPCTITMYNFGSPRIGNHTFRSAYNDLVPDSFRLVVDGDLVSDIPPKVWYQHLGTEVILDPQGGPNMIIDPSTAERTFQTRTRSSLALHRLEVYRSCICSVLGEVVDKEILEALARTEPEDLLLLEIEDTNTSFPQQVSSVVEKVISGFENLFRVQTPNPEESVPAVEEPQNTQLSTKLLRRSI